MFEWIAVLLAGLLFAFVLVKAFGWGALLAYVTVSLIVAALTD